MLNRTRSAQSLLEAIIAIGVILVATISATTLIVTTIAAGRASTDKIEAVNFAREGVEVVRQIRDSNWMKRAQNIVDGSGNGATTAQWDDSGSIFDGYKALGDATGKCYFAVLDPQLGWALNVDTANPVAPCASSAQAVINKVTDNGPEFMTQQYCPIGAGQSCKPTKYSRLISVQLLPDAVAGSYLNITSTIVWKNRGNKTLAVTERLYDWR